MGGTDKHMSDSHGYLQYLPVEVSGQSFAIPMVEVMAVRQLSPQDVSPESDGIEAADTTIPVIDLPHLLFPNSQRNSGGPAYVVVLSIPMCTCAVLVDSIKPARRIDPADKLVMPPLLAGRRYPFSGALVEGDNLILIIDSRRLVDGLRQVNPRLIAETPHGS
jgi:chemotaxis signal transduction protein